MKVLCPVCRRQVAASGDVITKHFDTPGRLRRKVCSGSGLDALPVAIEQAEEVVGLLTIWRKELQEVIAQSTERLGKTESELLERTNTLEELKKRLENRTKGDPT